MYPPIQKQSFSCPNFLFQLFCYLQHKEEQKEKSTGEKRVKERPQVQGKKHSTVVEASRARARLWAHLQPYKTAITNMASHYAAISSQRKRSIVEGAGQLLKLRKSVEDANTTQKVVWPGGIWQRNLLPNSNPG